jgi:predicted transcriptional regulator
VSPKKQISADEEARYQARYEAGESIYEIASDAGRAPQTVHKILKRRGVEMRTRGGRPRGIAVHENGKVRHRELSDDERAWIVAEYQCRTAVSQIARELRTSLGTVYAVLREADVTFRGVGQQPALLTTEERREVVDRYNAGQAPTGIAGQMRRGAATIRRVLREEGIEVHSGPRVGPMSPGWKGGRVRWAGGYTAVWVGKDDPMRSMARADGYIAEHRLVMARAIARPLERHETVHHINGIRDDNRLENLQLRTGRHGKGAAFRCRDCGSHNVEAVEIADPAT